MKYLRLLLLIAVVGSLFTLTNCGGGGTPEADPKDVQLAKLSKTWKIKTVTNPSNADVTSTFTGFTLTISGTKGAASFSYSTTNRPPLSVWKSSGSWIFGTNVSTQLTRDPDNVADKQDMNYVVSDTSLELNFAFPAGKVGYSRIDQVEGNWKFVFQP